MLAEDLNVPFVELSREIETEAFDTLNAFARGVADWLLAQANESGSGALGWPSIPPTVRDAVGATERFLRDCIAEVGYFLGLVTGTLGQPSRTPDGPAYFMGAGGGTVTRIPVQNA